MFITSKETEMSLNCQDNDMFAGDEEDKNETVIKEMEDILSFEGKSEVQRQCKDEQVFVFKDNNNEGEWYFNQQLEENVIEVRESKRNLLCESEFVDSEQKRDVVEEDILKDI